MFYKYPPIYKYGCSLIIIFMFFKHQKIMSQEKTLISSILLTLVYAILDYMIIENHPNIFFVKPEESDESISNYYNRTKINKSNNSDNYNKSEESDQSDDDVSILDDILSDV